MNITKLIAFRQLFSKHSFGFIYITSILSLIGLTIGLASLISISCLSEGFSKQVHEKLSSIDAHIRIESFYDRINIGQYFEEITDSLNLIKGIYSFGIFTENHAMIKRKDQSEGIISYGLKQSVLEDIFSINDFKYEGNLNFNNENDIIIGKGIKDKLGIEVGDKINLFNVSDILIENKINAKKFRVIGVFTTQLTEFDRLLTFIREDVALNFFGDENKKIAISVHNPNLSNDIRNKLEIKLDKFPLFIRTWQDRHSGIISWLNVFDIPLKLIMLFIVLVSVFNIITTIWMLSIEKSKEFAILRSVGISQKQVREIIQFQILILTLVGAILGIIISAVFLWGQEKFHWISLSSDIYFMDYLPVSFNISYFIVYPICLVGISLISGSILSKVIANKSIVDSLRYE